MQDTCHFSFLKGQAAGARCMRTDHNDLTVSLTIRNANRQRFTTARTAQEQGTQKPNWGTRSA
jgi:hypothetical protein